MTETDDIEALLKQILSLLPNDLKDEETEDPSLELLYYRKVRLNSWTRLLYNDGRDQLELHQTGRHLTGIYRRKQGQFNLAGIWKSMRENRKNTAKEKARKKQEAEETVQRQRLLTKMSKYAVVQKGPWEIEASEEGDPYPKLKLSTGEFDIDIECDGSMYGFGDCSMIELDASEMRGVLKIFAEAIMSKQEVEAEA